jgi:hypothetical protein
MPLVGTVLTVTLNNGSNAPVPIATEGEGPSELNVAILPGAAASAGQGIATAAEESPVTVAFTTVTTSSQSRGVRLSTAAGAAAVTPSSTPTTAPSAGQSLLTPAKRPEESRQGDGEPIGEHGSQESSIWSRFLPDVGAVFDQMREEIRARERSGHVPKATDETGPQSTGAPHRLPSPPAAALDEAIPALWAEEPEHAPPIRPVFHEPSAVGTPLVLSGIAVIRANAHGLKTTRGTLRPAVFGQKCPSTPSGKKATSGATPCRSAT